MESWLLRQLATVQAKRLDGLLERVQAGNWNGQVPGSDLHDRLVESYDASLYRWGMDHGARELDRLAKKNAARRFQQAPPSPSGVAPANAIAWAKSRTLLQGKWHRDLDAAVTDAIVASLGAGDSIPDLMARLKVIFPMFSKHRLENIARTETAAAYNTGRMVQFLSSPMVVAFQFSSIIDARTTEICTARNGKIILANSPDLEANTPPLHFQCRSVLIPIDKYDWEDLQSGKKDTIEDYLGWAKNGPNSLDEAIDWADAPHPLVGFGGLHIPRPTPKGATVKAVPPPPDPVAPKATKKKPVPTEDEKLLKGLLKQQADLEKKISKLLKAELAAKKAQEKALKDMHKGLISSADWAAFNNAMYAAEDEHSSAKVSMSRLKESISDARVRIETAARALIGPRPARIPKSDLAAEVFLAQDAHQDEIDGYIAAGKILRTMVQVKMAGPSREQVLYDKYIAAHAALGEYAQKVHDDLHNDPEFAAMTKRIDELRPVAQTGDRSAIDETMALLDKRMDLRIKSDQDSKAESDRLLAEMEAAKAAYQDNKETDLNKRGLAALRLLSEIRDMGTGGASVAIESGSQENKAKFIEDLELLPRNWSAVVVKDTQERNKLTLKDAERGHWQYYSTTLNVSPSDGIMIHETGHWIEDLARLQRKTAPAGARADLNALAREYWKRRTAGDTDVKLMDLFPSGNYRPEETVKVDRFKHPYMGKDYGDDASEIISMGLEGIFLNESNNWEDLEYTDFMLGLLATYEFYLP